MQFRHESVTEMAEQRAEIMDGNSLEQEDQLPNELLTFIFQFLPFGDLKNVLMVCRLARASKIFSRTTFKKTKRQFFTFVSI